ncbi:hypothetical protein XarCFBP6771_02955 [Xanthomonas arboricola]|nr:hypothetical protein XarCFBP6771_02955 [Xanthomonas arboricola]
MDDLIEHGLVKVIVTDLTIMEIAKRFRNNDFDKLDPLTKSELRSVADRHLGLKIPEINREALRESLFEHHLNLVQTAMKKRFKASIVSIDEVKPSEVLKHYTEGTGLFGPSGKKDQFPDAFIFAAIGAGATEHSPLTVWSNDGDFASACDKEEHIQRVTSMPKLLEALGIQPEGEGLIQLIEDCPDKFEAPLEDVVSDYSVDATDVEDAEIIVLEVLAVNDLKVSALYRISAAEDTYIGFGKCTLSTNASYSHPDWDTAIWDSEDKVAIPLEKVDGEKEVEIDSFSFSFLADINDGVLNSIYDCEVKETWGLSATLHSLNDYY